MNRLRKIGALSDPTCRKTKVKIIWKLSNKHPFQDEFSVTGGWKRRSNHG